MFQVLEIDAKLVICNQDMAECVKQALGSSSTDSRQAANLVTLQKLEKDLKELKKEDSICEPIKCNDIKEDVGLIMWNPDENGSITKNEKLTQANLFI